MKRSFKFIFLILIFLISCDPKQDTKKVSYIKIEQAIQKTSFYINDQNNSQELFVLSYDQNDKLAGYSSVIWTSNLPDSTIISKTDSSFVFDVNSIGELGDYFIKAQSKNNAELEAEYVFSLISKNSLNDSLTYSYADLSSTQLTFTDDNKINIDQITEYDKNGNKINSSEQRMTLQDEINFTGTGMNFLYISLKENVNLGKINTEISSENLNVFHTTDDGLIIGGIADEQSVSVTLSAGSKESKQITIRPLNSFISLTAPVISDPVYSELYDGQLITITGDSVNTTYYPVENGNNLEITILRRKYHSSDEYQPYTYYKTNEETKEIKYGQVIHLKHAGDYIVSARISNAVFSSDYVEKYISIAPKTISSGNLEISPHVPEEKVDSKLLWTDLQAGSTVPQDYFYKVYLENNFNGNLIVYINHIETSGQTELQEYKLLSQETLSENYNKSGTYLITVKCENFLSGFGEILNEDLADDCAILSSFEIKDSEISDEILSITGDRIYTITASDSLPEHAVIYVALLKDDIYDSTFTLTSGEEHIIENTDNKSYKFKAYVYFDENRASSIMYEYGTDIPTLLTSALPKITDNDNVQNARNQRRVQLNLTQDAYGNYRPTFYRWDDDPTWHEFDRAETVYASTSQEGKHILHIKVLPSQAESVIGEVITSCTVNLSKLSHPSAYIKYSYGIFGGGFVHGYVCSTFQGATVEAQGHTNHKEGNVTNHWNYTEITQSTSFIKLFYDTGGYSWLLSHYWTESIYAYQYKNGYIDSGHIYVEYYGKDSIYEKFTDD